MIPERFRDLVFWLGALVLPPVSPLSTWLNSLLAFFSIGLGVLLWKLEPNRKKQPK